MRTTLTLDPDNAAKLERLRKERDVSLKELVNDAIRRGLREAEKPAQKRLLAFPIVDLGRPLFDSTEELKAMTEESDLEEARQKLGLK